MKPKILLLDADIIAYKFAATNQRIYSFPNENDELEQLVITSDLDVVCHEVDDWIEFTKELLDAKDVIVCLTDKYNFRKKVYPPYKANRKNVVKPELLVPIKRYMESHHRSYIRPGLEADDVMGILATSHILDDYETIIVSTDKDMNQIPGLYYNPDKDEDPINITKESGEYWFYTQVLTGDAVDGYPGCPGIGSKKAEKILIEADDYWTAIVSTYESKGLTEEDALIQARCARILQACDYDFKLREPILWKPINKHY